LSDIPDIRLSEVDPEKGVGLIFYNGKPAGHYKKAVHGPGFFVAIEGAKWRTAEGARYHQERDAEFEYAYARSKKAITLRAIQALTTQGVLRNK